MSIHRVGGQWFIYLSDKAAHHNKHAYSPRPCSLWHAPLQQSFFRWRRIALRDGTPSSPSDDQDEKYRKRQAWTQPLWLWGLKMALKWASGVRMRALCFASRRLFFTRLELSVMNETLGERRSRVSLAGLVEECANPSCFFFLFLFLFPF